MSPAERTTGKGFPVQRPHGRRMRNGYRESIDREGILGRADPTACWTEIPYVFSVQDSGSGTFCRLLVADESRRTEPTCPNRTANGIWAKRARPQHAEHVRDSYLGPLSCGFPSPFLQNPHRTRDSYPAMKNGEQIRRGRGARKDSRTSGSFDREEILGPAAAWAPNAERIPRINRPRRDSRSSGRERILGRAVSSSAGSPGGQHTRTAPRRHRFHSDCRRGEIGDRPVCTADGL